MTNGPFLAPLARYKLGSEIPKSMRRVIMEFQLRSSKLGRLAAIGVLALAVSSVNAQAIRPGAAAQAGKGYSCSSQLVPSTGPWPERIANLFHNVFMGGGLWFR
jgi:hypothetical protein